MGNKGGKRVDASAAEVDAASVKDADPPPLCAADADGLSDAAVSLRGCGVACVRVDDSAAALHRACFDVAKDGMDHCEELVRDDDPLVLDDSADSGHATGVHVAGWGSAYNQTREGFVFSDGATFGVPPDDPIAANRFEAHCAAMHTSALALARGVLAALERDLGIPLRMVRRKLRADRIQLAVAREAVPPGARECPRRRHRGRLQGVQV